MVRMIPSVRSALPKPFLWITALGGCLCLWTTSVVVVVKGQTFGQCASELAAYATCTTITAFGQCDNCFDQTPNVTVDESTVIDNLDRWCEIQFEAACPVITCCPLCETELTAYYQCLYDGVVEANPAIPPCTFACDGDDGTSGGDEQQTNSTSPGSPGTNDTSTDVGDDMGLSCMEEMLNYTSCFMDSGINCDSCENFTSIQSGLDGNLSLTGDVCDYTSAVLCPFLGCCSACSTELQKYYECFLALDNATATTEQCTLNCNGTDSGSGSGGGGGIIGGGGGIIGGWLNETLSGNGTSIRDRWNNTILGEAQCWNKSLVVGLCFENNGNVCQSCGGIDGADVQDLNVITGADVCTYQTEALCPFIQCCSACEDELISYYTCLFDLYHAGNGTTATSRSACNFQCDDDGDTPTSAGGDGGDSGSGTGGGDATNDTSTDGSSGGGDGGGDDAEPGTNNNSSTSGAGEEADRDTNTTDPAAAGSSGRFGGIIQTPTAFAVLCSLPLLLLL